MENEKKPVVLTILMYNFNNIPIGSPDYPPPEAGDGASAAD